MPHLNYMKATECYVEMHNVMDNPQDQIVFFFKHCLNGLCIAVHVYSATKAISTMFKKTNDLVLTPGGRP